MKKNLLLIAAVFCISIHSFATMYMVSAGGMSFTPATVTMHAGDTIMWMWTDGTHTTTSTNIPSGATAWNSNLNSSSPSFMYVPTVLGTYSYQCNFHASMGMVGTFTVTSPNAVTTIKAPEQTFKVYPNPVTEIMTVHFNNNKLPVQLTLTDLVGKVVMKGQYNATNELNINLKTIPNGIYILNVMQNGAVSKQQLVVNH